MVAKWLRLTVSALMLAFPASFALAAGEGTFEICAVDKDTQQLIPVRIHLKNAQGKPVIPPKTVAWKDHFVFDGKIMLKLPPGTYSFEMERGPEYRVRFGNFVIEKNASDTHTMTMERYVDMKSEGWWSGDMHVHRSLEDIELLMRAEDLHVAPVITWWSSRKDSTKQPPPEQLLVNFDQNRFYHVLGGEDERGGGALLFFNLKSPLPVTGLARDYPSETKFISLAREQPEAHIDVEKPFWWDAPVWIATGKVDSIGLANNHLWRDGGMHNEAWGKAREKSEYPDPHGNGRWSQDIYYHLLNCGLRIPPSAGSASGVLANPVGYNRVYAYCGDSLNWQTWWEALRAGKVCVTNGPLLRPRVNGELPGHIFSASAGEQVTLDIALEVAFREKVDYLEVIKNGIVAQAIRLDEFKQRQGKLPRMVFEESGWLLVRAVTNNEKTYRFGTTGPYYVQIGSQPRISKKSAQFFVEWVEERSQQIKLEDPKQREEVVQFHRQASEFWRDRLAQANAE